jgi:hypothetical protein
MSEQDSDEATHEISDQIMEILVGKNAGDTLGALMGVLVTLSRHWGLSRSVIVTALNAVFDEAERDNEQR